MKLDGKVLTGTLLFVDLFTNLVGGIPTPLKNGVKVSWDDDIRNIGKVIKFHGSKPPTS